MCEVSQQYHNCPIVLIVESIYFTLVLSQFDFQLSRNSVPSDMLVSQNFSGHIIITMDEISTVKGEKLFIFVQGNMPAQVCTCSRI